MLYSHGLLQRLSLIIASPFLLPLCTFIAAFSHIISPITPVAKRIRHYRRWRAISSSTFRPRTILVTGVASSEGLALARIFYRAGHKVIGVDFEPYLVPVPSRFSVTVARFYRLSSRPTHIDGVQPWCEELVNIVKREKVELLVCCCNAESFDLYSQAADAVSGSTICKTIQFSASLTENLLNPEYFLEETLSLGLNISETPIDGPTYQTQSLVIRGQVLAFTSCRSPGKPIQYASLPPSSAISIAMLECVNVYAKEFGREESGNFCVTFALDAEDPEPDLRRKIYPTKCNPGVSTPILLFSEESEDLADAYCTILPDYKAQNVTTLSKRSSIVIPESSVGIYWIEDCLWTLIVLPLLDFLRMKTDVWNFLALWVYFIEHVLFWKEGIFEIWDPWFAWWQYGLYQPTMAFIQILTEKQ